MRSRRRQFPPATGQSWAQRLAAVFPRSRRLLHSPASLRQRLFRQFTRRLESPAALRQSASLLPGRQTAERGMSRRAHEHSPQDLPVPRLPELSSNVRCRHRSPFAARIVCRSDMNESASLARVNIAYAREPQNLVRMQMYRIELSPGEEAAFRSIEELAVAIRRGIVTSRARIWHNASGKWLPIEFHPHYKIAASMQLTAADLAAGAPVKPLELLTLGALMDPPAPPPASEPPAAQPKQLVRAKRTPEPEPKPRKKAAAKSRRPKSGRNSLRIALGGALLVACAHLAFSAASAAHSEDVGVRPRTHRRLITEPAHIAQDGGPETTAAAVLPGFSAVARPVLRSSGSARSASSAPRPTESAVQDGTPALESQSEAATAPLGAFRTDSGPAVPPAPEAVDIAAPAPISSSPLGKIVDSTGKKTLKGILRTVAGTATTQQSRPKR
jgi:hypothetical protein